MLLQQRIVRRQGPRLRAEVTTLHPFFISAAIGEVFLVEAIEQRTRLFVPDPSIQLAQQNGSVGPDSPGNFLGYTYHGAHEKVLVIGLLEIRDTALGNGVRDVPFCDLANERVVRCIDLDYIDVAADAVLYLQQRLLVRRLLRKIDAFGHEITGSGNQPDACAQGGSALGGPRLEYCIHRLRQICDCL